MLQPIPRPRSRFQRPRSAVIESRSYLEGLHLLFGQLLRRGAGAHVIDEESERSPAAARPTPPLIHAQTGTLLRGVEVNARGGVRTVVVTMAVGCGVAVSTGLAVGVTVTLGAVVGIPRWIGLQLDRDRP